MNMKNDGIKLGWFNAWVGYVWVFLFIHCIKFFVSYELFLERSFTPIEVSKAVVEIKQDSSEMRIETEKGVFLHYNKDNYIAIVNLFRTNNHVEIWYNKEDKNTADFRVNNHFLINRTTSGLILYSICLIFSGGVIVLSTLLLIKTKGWGTYELMEKNSKKG